MKAITIADKLVLTSRILIVSALITLPLNAQAEYYLVYGPPMVPVVCDSCQARPHYRPVHKVYKAKKCKTTHKKHYRHAQRRSHYNITVYYPVPVSGPYCSSCCGGCGFMQPIYSWVPAPYEVYYASPNDRIVGNNYRDNYRDPSLDTGTADNDIYY